MYRLLFRLILVRMDPERAHHLAYEVIRLLPRTGLGWIIRRLCAPDARLAVRTLGQTFPSPFGLAAGFDKDARAIRGLGQFGFGHVEIGTVTAHAQPGNPTPRLFRLVEDRAVINRMGFNNHGAEAAAEELVRTRRAPSLPVIGVNIGKSRVVEVDDAEADYRRSARTLAPLADYMVVNVSSPNTPGLRGLQELDRLEPLLVAVREEIGSVPLLVKIAPDLQDEEIVHLAQLAVRLGLDGIIATNTTISREGLRSDPSRIESAGAGGLSGRPLAARALEVLRLLRSVVPADLCLISVGGVDTSADVRERLAAGATLVQGYTAYLYRGPFWARGINRELAKYGELTR
ncbi:quinone-dependent dihydroorotate dehydrogenase [Naasia lichenicola]|uniref:Dihydroorotate dehydrogenase (quinone) n=1 Tax=Naasia lichenicola TaxID=2565933 RepID=A0A4S4FRY9_9MICO|nr:quinone-dependent dihydroorotate dehydrogenase [Naasia lichenicola]THG33449.1 quinone-dependent dihydroorotate dehydrogenase [Naasia lichenicola]